MGFLNILKSVDELLYEVMAWLVFYPVTLWRAVRHPLLTMAYAAAELKREREQQFRETLSPPIFLLVSILVAYVIQLALVGDSPVVNSNAGLASVIDSDSSLVIFRIVLFALFPVTMATIETLLCGKLNRDTLQMPFYAQCFLAAPYALVFSITATALRYTSPTFAHGSAMFWLGASVTYIWIEARWLTRATKARMSTALPAAIFGYVLCVAMIAGLSALLGGN